MDKNKQAIELIKQRKYEEAGQLLTQIIDDNPNDPIGYINLSHLFIQTKQFDEADVLLQRAIELDPHAAVAYYSMGSSYYEQEKYEKAHKYYEKAIELGLEDSDTFFMLGLSIKKQNNFMLAIPYLLRATELDPEDPEKLFEYGITLAHIDYLSEAREAFKQVLTIQSNHSDAYFNLGIISYGEKDFETSLNYFNKALEIRPDHHLAQKSKKQVLTILESDK